MKHIFLILLTTWSLQAIGSERITFSAIGKGENSIFVSTKKSGEKIGTRSSLYELDEKNKKEIKMPEELKSREVVGIFSNKKKLYIISQMTTEQGDNPVIYESINQKWKKVVELDCKNFVKIEVEKESVNVFCEQEENDKKKITNKIVTIKGMDIEKKITLPLTEINESQLSAKFEGIPFEWEKITVISKKSKVYKVSDF
jgi:hypothetical protein